jgi:hypothetical protein
MKHKLFILAVATAGLILCNGCALFLIGGAAAAGAGTVLYMDGQLKDTEAVSLGQAHAATLAAMHELKFFVLTDSMDAINAKITARTGDDKKVDIDLAKQSPTITDIRIRVGTFGDETMSRQILEKIKAHLGT